jgi:hypothetical protein
MTMINNRTGAGAHQRWTGAQSVMLIRQARSTSNVPEQ